MNFKMFTESRRLVLGVFGISCITFLGYFEKIQNAAEPIAAIAISVAVSNAYQKSQLTSSKSSENKSD
jgi:hypothetical protein